MSDHVVRTTGGRRITDPPIARFLFNDTRLAIVWLVIRVLVGWTWVSAAMTKINDPDWMLTGEALRRFWNNAIQIPAGSAKPPITFDWYRDFIQSMLNAGAYVWFAKLITVAELTVGILLILGLFTGIAAFIGGFLNWNYLMAGSASTNPLLFVGSIFLILAWKTAGYYGLDRFLLPSLGTPWVHDPPVVQQPLPRQERVPSGGDR